MQRSSSSSICKTIVDTSGVQQPCMAGVGMGNARRAEPPTAPCEPIPHYACHHDSTLPQFPLLRPLVCLYQTTLSLQTIPTPITAYQQTPNSQLPHSAQMVRKQDPAAALPSVRPHQTCEGPGESQITAADRQQHPVNTLPRRRTP